MGYEQVITLPERSIGRAGKDLFLSHKEITLIMVPYERYSTFPKAVDELYKTLEIPFNLIVVEGNAPEEIRIQLEKRQRQHGNMTIIYTNHCPALANAFNLALPHFKTPYALFFDNEMRLPKGMVEKLLEGARSHQSAVLCPQESMVERQVVAMNHNDYEISNTLRAPGLRPCFLIQQEAVNGMGKFFDEFSSPYTLGVDLMYRLRSKGLNASEYEGVKIETRANAPLRPSDMPIFRAQWNRERVVHSVEQLEKKWNIRLSEDLSAGAWLQAKMECAEKTNHRFDSKFTQVASLVRDNGWKRVQNTMLNLRSLGWSKEPAVSKVNVSR